MLKLTFLPIGYFLDEDFEVVSSFFLTILIFFPDTSFSFGLILMMWTSNDGYIKENKDRISKNHNQKV